MSEINEIIASWKSHRNVLHAMLNDAQTEHLGLKPWEKAMSLSALTQHIVGAMDMFVRLVKNGAYTPGDKPQPVETADELRARVAANTEASEAIIRSLSPEQLDATLDFFGAKLTGRQLLRRAIDHEIHHKGQLFIYLRMAGVESLPMFMEK